MGFCMGFAQVVFLQEKSKNPLSLAGQRIFMELLGRFELPTSSLPSVPDNLFVLLFVHVFSKTAYFLQTFICK